MIPGGVVGRLAWILGLTAVAIVLGTEHLARPWVVAGPSMEPTLQEGDRVLVDVWTYRHRTPRRGETVLLQGPASLGSTLVKRVAAPPPFPDDRPRGGAWPGARASGRGVWVLGDNPEESVDSRQFGPVPRDRVIGRVVLRYWPPRRGGSGFRLPDR